MAKQPIQPVSSYFDVMSLLRVLADPADYLDRLENLEKARQELNEEIGRQETLARLQDLETQLKAKVQAAQDALGDAQVESARTRAEAEADANATREQLRQARAEWQAEAARQQDALAAKTTELETRERDARAIAEKGKTELARGEYLAREANKLIEEYKTKLVALKGIVA